MVYRKAEAPRDKLARSVDGPFPQIEN